MEITPDQVRAARALLRIEQSDLARRARVSVTTVKRLEAATGLDTVAATTMATVRTALEQAGAEFIANGVRRRAQATDDIERRYADLLALSDEIADLIEGDEPLTDNVLYDEDGLPA